MEITGAAVTSFYKTEKLCDKKKIKKENTKAVVHLILMGPLLQRLRFLTSRI